MSIPGRTSFEGLNEYSLDKSRVQAWSELKNSITNFFQVCPTADNCETTAKCGGSTGGTRRRRRNTIQADTFINVGKHRRN